MRRRSAMWRVGGVAGRDRGSAEATAGLADTATPASGVAHSPQNLAPGVFGVAQFGQITASGVAHSLQNFRPASFSVPQLGQITGRRYQPVRVLGRENRVPFHMQLECIAGSDAPPTAPGFGSMREPMGHLSR